MACRLSCSLSFVLVDCLVPDVEVVAVDVRRPSGDLLAGGAPDCRHREPQGVIYRAWWTQGLAARPGGRALAKIPGASGSP